MSCYVKQKPHSQFLSFKESVKEKSGFPFQGLINENIHIIFLGQFHFSEVLFQFKLKHDLSVTISTK